MSESTKKGPGAIVWQDLTVPDAVAVKDFYAKVVGLKTSSVDMGGYSDFNLHRPDTGDVIAGVCHAKGPNTGLPPQWLLYMMVEDVDAAAAKTLEMGGEIVSGPKDMGKDRMVVIKDPAGAAIALYQSAKASAQA